MLPIQSRRPVCYGRFMSLITKRLLILLMLAGFPGPFVFAQEPPASPAAVASPPAAPAAAAVQSAQPDILVTAKQELAEVAGKLANISAKVDESTDDDQKLVDLKVLTDARWILLSLCGLGSTRFATT
jgi:hypothetical protein